MTDRSPSPTLRRVAGAQVRYDEARAMREVAVRHARDAGFSWELIAEQLGMTKQAAWQQFRHVDADRELALDA